MKLLETKEHIMIKNLIRISICFFIFSPLFANLTQKESIMLQELDIEQYKALLKKFQTTYKDQQNNKEPDAMKYVSIKRKLKLYSVHPFVTADTGVKAKWFQAIYSTIEEITNAVEKEEVAKRLKDKKGYLECDKLMEGAYTKFEEYAKKPPKEKTKVVKSLQKKARSIRSKLNKKREAEQAKEDALKKKKHKKKIHKKNRHKKKTTTK